MHKVYDVTFWVPGVNKCIKIMAPENGIAAIF